MQLEPVYGELLSRHGRLLRQRSQLLRRSLNAQAELLDAFDQQLAAVGVRLHRRRHRMLRRLEPLAAPWQEKLSGGRELLQLKYLAGTQLEEPEQESIWQASLLCQLQNQREQELRLGVCSVGPQRDDVALLLDGEPAKRLGSAGQQRCLVLALKLAELELVKQCSGCPPILLLDDVLAELDPSRQQLLLEAIGEGHQCLVSATHLHSCVEEWRHRAQLITVQGGSLLAEGEGLCWNQKTSTEIARYPQPQLQPPTAPAAAPPRLIHLFAEFFLAEFLFAELFSFSKAERPLGSAKIRSCFAGFNG
jgi:DNA replication and repair protein RecF